MTAVSKIRSTIATKMMDSHVVSLGLLHFGACPAIKPSSESEASDMGNCGTVALRLSSNAADGMHHVQGVLIVLSLCRCCVIAVNNFGTNSRNDLASSYSKELPLLAPRLWAAFWPRFE